MNSADRKLLMGVFSVILVVTLIFRHELLPFFFPRSTQISFNFRQPAPVIEEITAPSAPTTGDVDILITGTNFGTDPEAVTVAIGTNYCKNIQLPSVTQLTCTLPPGSGKEIPVVVTVDGVGNLDAAVFSYDPPKVMALQLHNFKGKTSGHELVTIQGTNFGSNRGSDGRVISVFIGTFEALDVEVINTHSLEVVTPRGFGKNLAVVVEVGGQKSTPGGPKTHLSYAPPSVEGIDPETGPTTGGTIIYIYGDNFGSHSAYPKALIGDNACVFVTWRSSTLLECILPAGTGRSKNVKVVVGGQASSVNTLFSYDAPSVSSISPGVGPTAGNTIVTVYGANFGTQPQTLRDVVFGAAHCMKQIWISDTEVSCTTPAGTGSDVSVGISVDGQDSERKPLWSYGEPTIMKVHPNHGPVSGGTVVTIQGANFGTDASQLDGISVDTVACKSIKWLSTHALSCVTPPGAGRNVPVRVTISGVTGKNQVWSYDAATLDKVTPNVGPAEGGILITITGKNFGTVDTDVRVFVGDNKCAVSHVLSDKLVTCLLPSGSGSGLTVRVVTDGLPSELLNGFSYNKPKILDIDPAFVSTSGGLVTIFGESFGTADSDATVKIGEAKCPVVSNTKSMVICKAPAGTGVGIPVVVTIDGQASNPVAKFSYEGPIVKDVEPKAGGADAIITVFGQNFGAEESSIKVWIGPKECSISAWLGEQRVTCVTPQQEGSGLMIKVEVNGQASGENPDVTFTYGDPRPRVSSISPGKGTTKGGNMVTIVGVNLKKDYLTVEFGERNKGNVKTKDEDKVVVMVPPSSNAGIVNVYVKDDGDNVLGTGALMYEYVSAATSTTTGPTTGGALTELPDIIKAVAIPTADGKDRLELTGDFSTIMETFVFDVRLFQLNDVRYDFDYKCKNPSKTSSKTIVCEAEQASAGKYVAITAGTLSSNKVKIESRSN